MKIHQKLAISFLCFFIYSCSDSIDKKIKNLPNCSTYYIKSLVVKANATNNIGNLNFNFYLPSYDVKEHYFYLKYKNKTHFLFYSSDKKAFVKYGLSPDSPFDLLFHVSKKVENEGYEIIPDTPKYRYEMTDKEIKKELLNIIDSATIISQDKNGNILNTYSFCKNSIVNVEKRSSYMTDCFVDYYPKYKKFDSIIVNKNK